MKLMKKKKNQFSSKFYCNTTCIHDSAPDTSSTSTHTGQDGENAHIHIFYITTKVW